MNGWLPPIAVHWARFASDSDQSSADGDISSGNILVLTDGDAGRNYESQKLALTFFRL